MTLLRNVEKYVIIHTSIENLQRFVMRLSRSDIHLLRVFDAIVRSGGFAAAEAELNISPSTISNHMSALEQRLGVRLCQRGRAGFALTETGTRVYEAAQRFLKSAQDFESHVDAVRGKLTGEIRIGIVDNIVTDPNSRLFIAIARFKDLAPNVTITLMQDRPQDLQMRILDGTYHCGIGSFPHLMSGLEQEVLYHELHWLYAGKGHPLFESAEDKSSVYRLREYPTILRRYWREEDQRRFLVGPIEATVDQIEPQLILILSGRFLGFLPIHYAERWVKLGLLRPIVPSVISYDCIFVLATRKGYMRTDVLSLFIDSCVCAHRDKLASADKVGMAVAQTQ